MELTIEDFERGIRSGLEKQLEVAEIGLIWNKYHKEFMKMPVDELKEITRSYSFPEKSMFIFM